MIKTDLHTHTIFSDGVHTAKEIFEMAKREGVTVVSITDHNWPYEIKNNAKLAKSYGLDYIEGIEISGVFEGKTVHVLAYSKDFDLEILSRGLEKQIKGFESRAIKIVKSINDSGDATIDYDEMKKDFPGCIQNFPIQIELGRALNSKPLEGIAKEVYSKHEIGYGDWLLDPIEVVKIIHQSRGVAILAHPAVYWRKRGKEQFNLLLSALLDAGLDGLESNHSEQNEQEEQEIKQIAKDHNLIITGGSDFHGMSVHPGRSFAGKSLDEDNFKIFLKKLEENCKH